MSLKSMVKKIISDLGYKHWKKEDRKSLFIILCLSPKLSQTKMTGYNHRLGPVFTKESQYFIFIQLGKNNKYKKKKNHSSVVPD